MECKHNFYDIDYEKLTMDEIIKFKLSAINVLNAIEWWYKPNIHDNNSEFDGFSNVITAAYGMFDNPYSGILSSILKIKHRLEKVIEYISEYWILENIGFVGKQQTFNIDLILPQLRYGGEDNRLDEWYKIVDDFDNAIVRYNEALAKRDTVILKKYLKFTNTRNKIDKYWYRYETGNCYRIEYKNGELIQKKYHFGDNWFIYTSTVTLKFSKNDKLNEHIWKAEAPEKFLI
jgi:hypothetical protein